MAYRVLFPFFLLLLSPSWAWAQAALDTTVALPNVTVTATRARAELAAIPTRVTVLGEEAVESSGAQNVAELLSARAGLFVKRYGDTGLATLSLRGTGASQTLILLDGHRIADPQLGQLDLSLLPTILLESVDVMHGAGSSLYGSDGLGGVVHLRSYTPGAGTHVKLEGGYGAFGERLGGLMLSGKQGAFSGTALAEYSATDGDFPYVNDALFPPREVHRENADHERLALYSSARYQDERHDLRLSGWYNDAEQGLPGLATTPPDGERQWDKHLRLWFDDEMHLDWGTLRLGGLAQRATLRYANPQLEVDDTGRTLISALEAEANAVVHPRWLLSAGVTGGYNRARHPSLAGDAREWHTGVFASGTGQYGRLLLYPALRTDTYFLSGNETTVALSPRLGANLRLPTTRPLHLKANVGRAFRMPTFNDRFWQPGGHPDLRPEHGWTADTGLFWQQRGARAEMTFFAARTHDQIVWSRTEAGHYAPENVRRTRTLGTEASVGGRWTWLGIPFSADIFYTFTDARDRSDPEARSYNHPLRHVPREQLKLHFGAGMGPLTVDLNGRYTGRRYVTTDGTQSIDPHVVVNAQARLTGHIQGVTAQLVFALENMLDAEYAVLPNYPMPPRHARVRLILESGERCE